jgi:hypothetical protein
MMLSQVFVEFQSKEECQKAQAALTGRKFANRVVVGVVPVESW